MITVPMITVPMIALWMLTVRMLTVRMLTVRMLTVRMIAVRMIGVLVQFLVSVTAEVEVRSSVVTIPLCGIASGMRVRHTQALVGQQQESEQEGERSAEHFSVCMDRVINDSNQTLVHAIIAGG